MKFELSLEKDAPILAEIRARAMKPSLQSVGRFDENRVRSRFLNSYIASETIKLIYKNKLVGFYVLKD